MMIKLSMSRLLNAENITHNGVEGVFIPAPLNLQTVRHRNGVTEHLLNLFVNRIRAAKGYTHLVVQAIPEKWKDERLMHPESAEIPNEIVGWGFDNQGLKKGEGSVLASDLERLIGD